MAQPDRSAFPDAPEGWTVEQAQEIARDQSLTLTDDHLDAIRGLQEYFSKHEFGNRRELVDALNEKFHHKGGTKYLYLLFPGGPVAQGCVIAGLKPPPGSVDQSFGSVV